MNKRNNILSILLIIVTIWVSITCMIQRIKCDSLTEMQVFKKIPQSFILKFDNCNE